MMGVEELADTVNVWCEGLNNLFLSSGHALHFVYERDPEDGVAVSQEAMARAVRSARGRHLDLEDLFAERVERLGSLVAREWCVLASWTRPSCLLADQAKRDRDHMVKRLKDWAARAWAVQCPEGVWRSLPARHSAFDAAVAEAVRVSGLSVRRLDAVEALRRIRVAINGPGLEGGMWRPDIPGIERHGLREGKGVEGGLWLPLVEQLVVSEPIREAETVALGGRVYAPLDVVLGPRTGRPFSELLSRVVEAGGAGSVFVPHRGRGSGDRGRVEKGGRRRGGVELVREPAHQGRLRSACGVQGRRGGGRSDPDVVFSRGRGRVRRRSSRNASGVSCRRPRAGESFR